MKKILYIAVVLLVVVCAAAVGLYAYLPIGDVNPETGEIVKIQDYLPIANDRSGDPDSSDAGGDQTQDEEGGSPADTTSSDEETLPALRDLSGEPVAGAIAFEQTEQVGTSTHVFTEIRYTTVAQGHVHSARSDRSGTDRVTNETNRKTVNSVWTSPVTTILQTVDTNRDSITSLLVTIHDEQATSSSLREVSGNFLSNTIKNIVSAPTGGQIVLIRSQESGGVSVEVGQPGEQMTVLYTTPLSDWQIAWPASAQVLLTTNPGAGDDGFLYSINTQNGARTRLLGGIAGLTVRMNSGGSRLLYNESTRSGFQLYSYTIETGESSELVTHQTLPEKCTWSSESSIIAYCGVPREVPSAQYPDDWYKGRVSFDDHLARFNVETGKVEILEDLSAKIEGGGDVIEPFLGPNEEYLFFTNKKDGHLWSYRLSDSEEAASTNSGSEEGADF